jgi:hypothetical protein
MAPATTAGTSSNALSAELLTFLFCTIPTLSIIRPHISHYISLLVDHLVDLVTPGRELLALHHTVNRLQRIFDLLSHILDSSSVLNRVQGGARPNRREMEATVRFHELCRVLSGMRERTMEAMQAYVRRIRAGVRYGRVVRSGGGPGGIGRRRRAQRRAGNRASVTLVLNEGIGGRLDGQVQQTVMDLLLLELLFIVVWYDIKAAEAEARAGSAGQSVAMADTGGSRDHLSPGHDLEGGDTAMAAAFLRMARSLM